MYKPDGELRALQLRCVEILEYFDLFCRENEIEYALCGGSAIGAYMYEGFIPWDDDVDVMMTRKNYSKFLKKWKKANTHQYKLIHYSTSPNAITLFAKIVDEKSTIVEKYNNIKSIVTGAFIDITVFDDCCSIWFGKLKRKFARFCWLLNLSANGLLSKKYIVIPFCIRKRIIHFFELIIRCHIKKTNRLQEYLAVDGDSDMIQYPKHLFLEYKDALFEGKQFRVLKHNYEYLCLAYNRTSFYLPEDQQIPHHFHYSNMELPYKQYLDNNKD